MLVIDSGLAGALKFNGQAPPTTTLPDTGNNGASESKLAFSAEDGYHGWNKSNASPFLSITVLGATGDLARNKIFPALFALYYGNNLYKVCMHATINLLNNGMHDNGAFTKGISLRGRNQYRC